MQAHPNNRQRTRHTGVYFKTLANGKRSYHVSWKEGGHLHWKAAPGGERDAVQARAKIVSELGRGRRVAPTRQKFGEFATQWLESQKPRLGERTVDQYDRSLRLHLIPAFGSLRLAAITEDRLAAFVTKMRRQGYAPWTIRGTLVPLSRVLSHAVRRGHLSQSPFANLERDERPSIGRREQRVLSREEIAKLLEKAPSKTYRTLLATAVSTGARKQELLGLVWQDIDFEGGVVRIRAQLSRNSPARKPLKTGAATRDIVLTPSLAKILREHRIASRASGAEDFVFASATGRPLSPSNVDRRGLHVAAGGLRAPRPRFHDLRHTFASLLIAEGADVVFVSRQLGHASPDITLRIYAHLFDAERHSDRFRELLDGAIGEAVSGNLRVTGDRNGRKPEQGEMAQIAALGSHR